jgi:hypothetical protein
MNKQLNEIFKNHKEGKDVSSLVNKLAAKIIPIGKKDPLWEIGAQNLLKGVIISLLNNPKTTAETFTTDKIKEICELGNLKGDKLEKLRSYFEKQPLACRQLADAVVNNSDNTAKSYLGVLYNYLARL